MEPKSLNVEMLVPLTSAAQVASTGVINGTYYLGGDIKFDVNI